MTRARIGRNLVLLRARSAAAVAAAALLGASAPSEGSVIAMIRRVLAAPEATARLTIERSDPFGGPPTRERGRIWFLPGRGLRYRSSERGGQDIVIDRAREAFLLYSPAEEVVYRGPYDRAPSRLRRLIAEPERALPASLRPTAERRVVGGRARDGYHLRTASLGDSLPEISVWVSGDAGSGFPRWIALATDVDTVTVEFRDWTLLSAARASDLALSAPRGTREEPLDPRELLERTGPGGGAESR